MQGTEAIVNNDSLVRPLSLQVRLALLTGTVTDQIFLIHLVPYFGVTLPTSMPHSQPTFAEKRNLQTRWLLPVKTLENFDSLPEFANKCFHFLCKLAYDGVMQSKAVFRPSDSSI